jgi:hypothetical protein
MVHESPERCSLSVSLLYMAALDVISVAKVLASTCAQNPRLFFSCDVEYFQNALLTCGGIEAVLGDCSMLTTIPQWLC